MEIVRVSDRGRYRVVSLNVEEMDFIRTKAIAEGVESTFTAEPPWVILDLANLRYIDSTGLNSLLTMSRKASGRGGELVIACENEMLLKFFEIANISPYLRVFKSIPDAERHVAHHISRGSDSEGLRKASESFQ